MNAFWPWIKFLDYLDILNDLCEFFYEFKRLLGIFKIQFTLVTIFCQILDLLELLDILNWICYLIECLNFGMFL